MRFKSFFKKKTGIDWDERLVQISLDESLFQYKAPVGGKPVGYVPEFGQRKPSTLKRVREEEGSFEVKPEPEERDIQFARLIEQTMQAKGDDEVGDEKKEKKQPLTNDLTLAVAMDVDALVREKEKVEELAGVARLEDLTRNHVKAEPEEPEERGVKRDATPPAQVFAVQQEGHNVQRDEAAKEDTKTVANESSSPPAQTSPYPVSAVDNTATERCCSGGSS